MPKILDIANITVGKQRFADTRKGFFAVRTALPKEELPLQTRLRTTVTVINESASKDSKFRMPVESKGVFASWRDGLNREPQHDLYESKPLNRVKNTDTEDVNALILERKHNAWLEEVDAGIRKWFAKRGKKWEG